MTTKGRASTEGEPASADSDDASTTSGGSSRAAPAKGEPAGTRAHHAPSGVFRASGVEPRISGGWTIAEQFVREGYHYRLLRRPVASANDRPHLTKRERDALELACAGHGNKSIAQLLAVSPSTIGVLLFRAAGKLGVTARRDLILAYQALESSPEPGSVPDGSPKSDPEPDNQT